MSAKETQNTSQNGQGSGMSSRQLLLLLCGIGLVAMAIGSFIYRMEHPSLVVENQQHSAPPTSMEKGPSMEMIQAMMKKLDENPDDVQIMYVLGEQFRRMKAFDRAKGLYVRALKVEPDNLQVLRMLGLTEFNLQEYQASAQTFGRVIQLDPKDFTTFFNLGILNKHFLDKPDKAREYFQKVIDLPDVPKETLAEAKSELESLGN